MTAFLEDVYAPGGQRQLDSKFKTIVAALRRWGFEPWPPTAAKIHALGATLKSGGYLAAPNYLYSYKVVAERLGYSFEPPLQRALKDSVRSCERGVGGARQALPLDMDRLHLLPGDRTPWSSGGALCPRNCLVAGTWFLCREAELAGTRASLLEFDGTPGDSSFRVTWHLPSSKTDARAVGTSRSHYCRCGAGPPLVDCVVHALADQIAFLRRQFPPILVRVGPI